MPLAVAQIAPYIARRLEVAARSSAVSVLPARGNERRAAGGGDFVTNAVMYMLRLVMTVRAAPRLLALALVWSIAACGADDPTDAERLAPPASAVQGTTLAIQRRADGLEQVSLRGRPQHVTVARSAADGGLQHQCASDAR